VKEKNREIFIGAEAITVGFALTEDCPDTKAAAALISSAVNFGSDGDIEAKCIRAFALGMSYERLGGEE